MALNSDRGNNEKAAQSINAIFKNEPKAPTPFAMRGSRRTPTLPPKGTYPMPHLSDPRMTEHRAPVSADAPKAPAAKPRPLEDDDCRVEHSMEPDVHADNECSEEHSMEPGSHGSHTLSKLEMSEPAAAPRRASRLNMSRADIRRAFVMSEILGKPKSKR